MTKIVTYQSVHQKGIDKMMNEIALEFDEQIFPKPTRETPIVPNNYWVAINKGKTVGTIGILVVENDFGVLKKMMVKKEFRGQEFGISKKLLETAIEWCEENHISKLYLGTMNQFKAAQFFYKKNGFKQVSENELPKNFLKNPLDKVFFVQNLNNNNMDKALKTMIDNMPGKTGKSLDEWKKILKEKSFTKHSEGVKFLKTEYNVTHGFANTIVSLSKEDESGSVDLVKTQYQGKESLFPIYEALITYLKSLGSDVTITPKKGSVSIIRKRQFVLIKPATKTRIDLGFKLKDKPTTDRLENSGPFGTMCTHRVKISDVVEIDKELKDWIEEAYQKSK